MALLDTVIDALLDDKPVTTEATWFVDRVVVIVDGKVIHNAPVTDEVDAMFDSPDLTFHWEGGCMDVVRETVTLAVVAPPPG